MENVAIERSLEKPKSDRQIAVRADIGALKKMRIYTRLALTTPLRVGLAKKTCRGLCVAQILKILSNCKPGCHTHN